MYQSCSKKCNGGLNCTGSCVASVLPAQPRTKSSININWHFVCAWAIIAVFCYAGLFGLTYLTIGRI